MPRYTVEVPIWATVYVDAPDEAAALAKVREECADYLEVELGGDLSPFGDGCMLSAVGTVHPLPADASAEFYEDEGEDEGDTDSGEFSGDRDDEVGARDGL